MPVPSMWEHTSGRLAEALHRIESPDVYVVTVFLGAVPATDPRTTTLAVLWSTESHYASRMARASAVELSDLRWGTEFMLRADNEIWDAEQDPEGHAALAQWAADQGLTFHDDPDADEDDLTEEELSLHEEMVTKLIAVMRDLHANGVVRAAFGRDIPVTLVPHDSHAPFPEWNRQIHTPELYSQFGPYYQSIWSEG